MTTRESLNREPVLGRTIVIDLGFTAGLGLAMILGGYARLGSASFDFLRTFGGPYVWGAVLLAVAAVTAAAVRGRRPYLVAVLQAAALVHGLFGACFLIAIFTNGATPLIGPLLFWWNSARLMHQAQTIRWWRP